MAPPWRGAGASASDKRKSDDEAAGDAGSETASDDALSARLSADFLAHMNHEFRTPLSTVIGMLHLLETTELDRFQRNALESAERAARQLKELILSLGFYSALKSGVAKPEIGDYSPREVIEEAGDMAMLDAREKELSITIDIGEGLDARRSGDAAWLRQAVANLLDNAVKFTDAGDITLTAATGRDERIIVTVTDQGETIAAGDEARLFADSGFSDDSAARRQGGAGLGLVIARYIAERLGGGVEGRARNGGGAEFVLTVHAPLQRAKDAGAKASQSAPPGKRAARRILIAEDNKTNQRLIRILVERLGHEVVIVGNGQQALEAFVAGEFDIVLMDIHMPVLDGFSATAAIREREGDARRTPVVALTADARDLIDARAVAVGLDAVLEKPIDVALLDETIVRLTQAREP